MHLHSYKKKYEPNIFEKNFQTIFDCWPLLADKLIKLFRVKSLSMFKKNQEIERLQVQKCLFKVKETPTNKISHYNNLAS